jgi:DNA topoisomerase II
MLKTVDQFLDVDYKNYAEEVAFRRALPSVIDGFKPVRRKIFYYMLKNKNAGFIKVSAIAGGIAEKCNYQHGDASNAVINIAKDFPSSNNYSILIPKGMFGSKLLPKSASASRYIHAKYNLINDYELAQKNQDLESPEPEYFLPIIPLHIVNGISGIGIGYAVNILPRKLTNVIKSIMNYINGKEVEIENPYFNGCKYQIERIQDHSFEFKGRFHYEKDKLIIDELLPGQDRNKFVEKLISLQEKEIIKSYSEESKTEFRFIIKLNKPLNDEKIYSIFGLSKVFHENYTLLDENSNIIIFKNYKEMIQYFADYRLSVYTKRKELEIKKLRYEIEKNNAIINFIKKMKDVINAKGVEEIKALFKDIISEELVEFCLKKPLHSFMKMNIDTLLEEIEKYKKEIKYYQNVTEKELYLKDLDKLLYTVEG